MRKAIITTAILWAILLLLILLLFIFRESPMLKPFFDWASNAGVAWILGSIVAIGLGLTAYIWKKERLLKKSLALENNIATKIIVVSNLEEFGYEFETTVDSLRLRFSPGIYANPAVKVEDIQLEIKGERYDTDWAPMGEALSGDIDKGCYVRAILPKSFKPGIYQARILACIENKWHPSKPFTLNYQQPTADEEGFRK